MRSFIYAGAAAIAAFGMSVSAQATTFTNIDLQPDGGILTSTFGAGQVNAGAFTHTFNFTLAEAGSATGYVGTITLGGIGLPGDINFSSVTLNGNAFTLTPSGAFEYGLLGLTSLAAGPHSIVVTGSAVGGGSYSGTLNVAPVPEPATWAMMIGGFGIVGGALRRRATRAKVSFA